jgi:hypothetical protein
MQCVCAQHERRERGSQETPPPAAKPAGFFARAFASKDGLRKLSRVVRVSVSAAARVAR